ncbi:MAG: pilus assembly protein PilM [Candidatus Pacebacteria bacterium]|nr:pilus assembly protein PilM [Candidatus Paceibacterota bacterium]
MMDFNSVLKKLLKLINPQPVIGGLSISEFSVNYVVLSDGDFKKASISLAPGIIEDGKLKNGAKFAEALEQIRRQVGISKADDKVCIIASIPPNHVYTQSFNLPPITSEKHIQEAAALNLQLISPIDIKTAYFDWEKVGDSKKEGERLEILGSFINKQVIEDYVSAFKQAGFRTVAVEFSSLSIARLIKEKGVGIDQNRPYVAMNLSTEGLNFLIVRNGKLYFHYFVPWISGQERQVSQEMFKNIIIQEVKKILTFYSSHWNDQVGDLILVSRGLQQEVIKILKEGFPTLNTQPLVLENHFAEMPAIWFAALGSALRGIIPRSKDFFISLMAIGTEERFLEEQILSFVKIWRNALLTTFCFLLLVFFFSDRLLATISSNLERDFSTITLHQDNKEVIDLQKKAQEFNQLISKALAAKSKSNKYSSFIESIWALAGDNITIQRFSFDSPAKALVIIATATSEEKAIVFKNNVADNKNFKDVLLPLSGITANSDGSVTFTLSFKLTK